MPKAICAAAITAATAKAWTGYRRRQITVAASRTVTAMNAARVRADPAGICPTLGRNSNAASSVSARRGCARSHATTPLATLPG